MRTLIVALTVLAFLCAVGAATYIATIPAVAEHPGAAKERAS